MSLGATGGDRIEAARQTIHLWFDAGLVEGEVRGLEGVEPLARPSIRENQMIDQTRYKAWRSGPDPE
jgi:hypothetical protein